MTLYIDKRAGSKELVNLKYLQPIAELGWMDSADAFFIGNGPKGKVAVGVELKSIPDLLSSMGTGRLQGVETGQAVRMLREYDVCWLLYYGEYRAGPRNRLLQVKTKRGWKKHQVGKRDVPIGYLEAFLLGLVEVGFRVKHVNEFKDAGLWLRILYDWRMKPWDKHKSFQTFNSARQISPLPGMDEGVLRRARVAKELLPNLGYKRGIAAGKYFRSIKEMINASPEEWMKVDKVGKVLAKAVTKAVK